jgi:hydroxyacylglutathione hydrolase
MIFRQFLHEHRSCASYLVGCPTRGVAAVIDPQRDAIDYDWEARRHGVHITEVIETHVHADHPSAARQLANQTGATLRLGSVADVCFEFVPMSDGDVVEVGNRRIRAIHTPGHTPEHVCLLVDDWFVLTGDTLFVGDVGRVDLALKDVDEAELRQRARRLHSSLQKLLELPLETEIFPGHYAGSTCGRGMDGKPGSTIGRERRTNHALTRDIEGFVAFQASNAPPLPEDFERIKRANLGHTWSSGVPGETSEGVIGKNSVEQRAK